MYTARGKRLGCGVAWYSGSSHVSTRQRPMSHSARQSVLFSSLAESEARDAVVRMLRAVVCVARHQALQNAQHARVGVQSLTAAIVASIAALCSLL